MIQNDSVQKTEMLKKINEINQINGFDPSVFAVDYYDLTTGETRKRLPVTVQMAWFRMKYPEGKICVQTAPGKDCFVATARIYPSYRDPVDCYLAEASASRGPCAEKPSVSPREWAQTAAIGIALRNAGFGLQNAIAGEDFDAIAPDELKELPDSGSLQTLSPENPKETACAVVDAPAKEPTEEEKLELALKQPCPIGKFQGKTMGEVMMLDPKALVWIATKYTGDESIKEAAKRICEYSLHQSEQ